MQIFVRKPMASLFYDFNHIVVAQIDYYQISLIISNYCVSHISHSSFSSTLDIRYTLR